MKRGSKSNFQGLKGDWAPNFVKISNFNFFIFLIKSYKSLKNGLGSNLQGLKAPAAPNLVKISNFKFFQIFHI